MDLIFEHIKQIALIPSIHPNEEAVRNYIIEQLEFMDKDYKIDGFGNLYLIPKKKSFTLLSAHMDKQEAPYYEDLGDTIKGKLDDAVGIGIILTLAAKYNFHGLFTVSEECEQMGSKFAIDEGLLPDVSEAFIVDTSSKMELGKGPVIYTSFLDIDPNENWINTIISISRVLKINLQPMPGSLNDGVNIIQKIRNTIALEPHIDNYHTSREICSKKDIIDVFRILDFILKNSEIKYTIHLK